MNYLTQAAANGFLNGDLDWVTDTWRNALIDGSVPDDPSHTDISDIASSAIISDIGITGRTVADGGALSDAFDHGLLEGEITRTIRRHWIYHSSGMLVAHWSHHRGGPIARTIDGIVPVVILPSGPWWRFQVG